MRREYEYVLARISNEVITVQAQLLVFQKADNADRYLRALERLRQLVKAQVVIDELSAWDTTTDDE